MVLNRCVVSLQTPRVHIALLTLTFTHLLNNQRRVHLIVAELDQDITAPHQLR